MKKFRVVFWDAFIAVAGAILAKYLVGSLDEERGFFLVVSIVAAVFYSAVAGAFGVRAVYKILNWRRWR